MTFRILPLPRSTFEPLFALSGEALAAHRARRVVADAKPGYPCRVSLEDAEPGETLILLNYTHHETSSPYRASHAIYVREGAKDAAPEPGEVPASIRQRLISARVFDAGGNLIGGDVMNGEEVRAFLEQAFADTKAVQVHLHTARYGCFVAKAVRA